MWHQPRLTSTGCMRCRTRLSRMSRGSIAAHLVAARLRLLRPRRGAQGTLYVGATIASCVSAFSSPDSFCLSRAVVTAKSAPPPCCQVGPQGREVDLALGRGGATSNSGFVSSTVPLLLLNVTSASSTRECSDFPRRYCCSVSSLVCARSQGGVRFGVPFGVDATLPPLSCATSVAGASPSPLSSP